MTGLRTRGCKLLPVLAFAAVLAGCGGNQPSSPPPFGQPIAGDAVERPLRPTAGEPVETPTATEAPRRTPTAPQPTAPTEQPSRDPLADLVEGIELVDEPVLGADISWPQCPPGMGIPEKRTLGMPMPVPEARYVVIGLTNGPGFTPNPCLADQTAWVRERGLLAGAYAVASYPREPELSRYADDGPFDGGEELGALANVGYQQARFNLASMRRAGLLAPVVWIDVEPVPSFDWTGDREANAAVVTGLARGYTDAGVAIGVYSTPLLWEGVVGDLALGVPEWRAAGQTSDEEALSRCGADWVIQGGSAVMGQWVEASRDMNLTCPGVVDLAAYFHQY